MKRILIGHRGVGKSALLDRHQSYFPQIPHYDLDQVIAAEANQSIADLFLHQGETYFRDLEVRTFLNLAQQAGSEYVIAVGGGFNTEHLPLDAEVVYISRRTDRDGRLFLNRPRLNTDQSAIEESLSRYQQREPRFRQKAHWIYHMPEGLIEFDPIEKSIFQKNFSADQAYLTLRSEKEIQIWPCLKKFELRTDLFSVADIQRIVHQYDQHRFIVSIRSPLQLGDVHHLKKLRVDWPLELGPVPENIDVRIISIHDGHFTEALEKMNQQALIIKDKNLHLKFCPVVQSWDELQAGYDWQQEDPQNRSFLPRTDHHESHSRWKWFRSLMWQRQKINFIQGLTDLDDQPSFYDYLMNTQNSFGAVLGFPIHHSRTPIVQSLNMKDQGQILAIPLIEQDFKNAILFLTALGLRFAAVTSPLKLEAAKLIGAKEPINTLLFHKGKWIGTSTDAAGLQKALKELNLNHIDELKIAIWGGGGVITAIKECLPQAVDYSARTGTRRDHQVNLQFKADVVIWAAPRQETVVMPPIEWQPRIIIDLNYVENSLGLEYAQTQTQAEYFSGLEMFYAQAHEQFKFWLHKHHDQGD